MNLFEISDLKALRMGSRGELQVGVFPFEARKHLQTSREPIFLSTTSMRHILDAHGDHVTLELLLMLPKVLQWGMWVADRPTAFAVIYTREEDGQKFKAAVKITNDRRRGYLSSFHKVAPRKAKSILKRGNLIRPHWT